MPQQALPVLSVIVRRFRPEIADDIEESLGRLQDAAANQPGYLGEQNSLSHGLEYCELVTVFAFDSRKSLQRWESSDVRNKFVAELDQHPQESTKHTQFDDLAHLLHPRSRIRKIEIVVILIFWILVIGGVLDYLADLLLPAAFSPMWRNVLLISVNVVLISYVFLPWSSMMLSRLKKWFSSKSKAK